MGGEGPPLPPLVSGQVGLWSHVPVCGTTTSCLSPHPAPSVPPHFAPGFWGTEWVFLLPSPVWLLAGSLFGRLLPAIVGLGTGPHRPSLEERLSHGPSENSVSSLCGLPGGGILGLSLVGVSLVQRQGEPQQRQERERAGKSSTWGPGTWDRRWAGPPSTASCAELREPTPL